MKILSIDTSHGICSVALAENEALIATKTDNEPSRQAERLFLTIDNMLKENNLTYKDIGAVAADIGPGSFTGVRIGLAAARGIALAAKIPVIGVTGFEALAFAAKNQENFKNLLVVFDAKREQVFAQLLCKDSTSEEILLDYCHHREGGDPMPYRDFVGFLTHSCGAMDPRLRVDDNLTIIGDGAILVKSLLQDCKINHSITDHFKLPDAGMVALAAFEKIRNGNYSKNPTPLYIRKPDAKLPKSAGTQ